MKKIASITFIVLIMTSMSSCKLFRGKNKCDTCPSWKAEMKKVDTIKVKA